MGFHNRWYPLAVLTVIAVTIPTGAEIRLIAAPVFVATKLEAYSGRGDGGYLASHDLEDVLTVVDGNAELVNEVRRSGIELQQYLATQFQTLLAANGFVQAIPGQLPSASASQARALLRRLRELATG